MNLAFDHPLVLGLVVFCLPPLLGRGVRWLGFASLLGSPRDRVSDLLDLGLRVLAALPIAAIVIGLAGLHQRQQTVTRRAAGAHIVIALDRSLSMDEPFALRGERATESKTQAAARMVAQFFDRRPHDRFGLVAFSTAPIVAMPLTNHRPAVAAALAAMDNKALSDTDIGAGIAMALAQFEQDPPGAARVVVLVTDGGGEIPEQVRIYLRQEIARVGVHLYYLYLRAGDDPPLVEADSQDADMMHPAVLDGFLRSLGMPYQAFEAHDVAAIKAATDRISALETHPITYHETVPRRELAGWCNLIAAICLLFGLVAQLAERELVATVPPGVA